MISAVELFSLETLAALAKRCNELCYLRRTFENCTAANAVFHPYYEYPAIGGVSFGKVEQRIKFGYSGIAFFGVGKHRCIFGFLYMEPCLYEFFSSVFPYLDLTELEKSFAQLKIAIVADKRPGEEYQYPGKNGTKSEKGDDP